MWYAVISQDIDDSLELRKLHRPAHVERITELDAQGRVLVAGPHPAYHLQDSHSQNSDTQDANDAGFSGSLIVADFDSIEDAQAWAAQDPFVLNGIYAKVIVKPFTKVFPKT